jgi:hypothetical protein
MGLDRRPRALQALSVLVLLLISALLHDLTCTVVEAHRWIF